MLWMILMFQKIFFALIILQPQWRNKKDLTVTYKEIQDCKTYKVVQGNWFGEKMHVDESMTQKQENNGEGG